METRDFQIGDEQGHSQPDLAMQQAILTKSNPRLTYEHACRLNITRYEHPKDCRGTISGEGGSASQESKVKSRDLREIGKEGGEEWNGEGSGGRFMGGIGSL